MITQLQLESLPGGVPDLLPDVCVELVSGQGGQLTSHSVLLNYGLVNFLSLHICALVAGIG